ncbi:G-protein coupled receptor family C group 5 member D [Lampris incognitus]|uniref:G-protein coupled receptor family C group 5 member D n=1 Tax=Lampris incognitus TaxID=2546036 RepID=UPI0024B6250C|nr:G-protein coupled receptor family C group 5 member D [Lampris incognitus]
MWITKLRMAFSSHCHTSPSLLLFLFCYPLPHLCQTTQTKNSSIAGPTANNGATTASPTTASLTTSSVQLGNSSNSTSQSAVPGCEAGFLPIYTYLCDRQSAWGIVSESLTSLGFLVSIGLLVGLLCWTLWVCVFAQRQRGGIGGTVASLSLFLIGTAGVFAITFAFIIHLTPKTCPTRLFLFGVLFSLAFSCLLARCLALLGFAVARGWGEPATALGLFVVQVVIATEWLIIVLVRDGRPCEYSTGEFVMLLIYVLCLLAIGLLLSLRCLCRSCFTYSYSYAGATRKRGQVQATLLCLTLLLSACIWVVWIALLIRGNREMGRQPQWDDPVLSVALVANGWVLLLGHGMAQVAFLCMGEAKSKDGPLSFAGWTSPSGAIPGLGSQKEGRENGSFENDGEDKRGRRVERDLRSPYESGFSMTEIDPDKDYTIPRPQTTNISEPYDEYYRQPL